MVGAVLGLVGIVGVPLGVGAVQNIFTGFGQITDIQFQGEDIDQVVYRGEVIWERARYIQDVTSANCPVERTRVNDARDNASYWVQKMPDGKCWMLTNLAYGGGGTNTYGDVKTISNGEANTYTAPYYYIPPDSNRTTGITDPSTSTDGGATDPQYGYLYNWCAAMGAQIGTSACANATTPAPDTSISICPSGWRLPTGDGGELTSLINAIGATNDAVGSTNLRTAWLAMYSGYWNGSLSERGSSGYYWSSTQRDATISYYLTLFSSFVYVSNILSKQNGFAVRCVAV